MDVKFGQFAFVSVDNKGLFRQGGKKGHLPKLKLTLKWMLILYNLLMNTSFVMLLPEHIFIEQKMFTGY